LIAKLAEYIVMVAQQMMRRMNQVVEVKQSRIALLLLEE
jgi:hypothetical protein